jgi:uncharacterized membrane protein YeaQ/YmgE (transglycosylase-associated protein family)
MVYLPDRSGCGTLMSRMLGYLCATVGGWIGWALGAHISIFTAFVLSMVGTGVGLYLGRRFAANLS